MNNMIMDSKLIPGFDFLSDLFTGSGKNKPNSGPPEEIHSQKIGAEILSIAFSDSQIFISTSSIVHSLNRKSLSFESTIPTNFTEIYFVKVCNDTDLYISGGSSTDVSSSISKYELKEDPSTKNSISFLCKGYGQACWINTTNDGSILFSLHKNGKIVSWDSRTGLINTVINENSEIKPVCVDLSVNGKFFFVGFDSKVLKYSSYDFSLKKKLTGPESKIISVKSCSYRDLICVASCEDYNLYIWDSSSEDAKYKKSGHKYFIKSFDICNNLLVSGDINGHVFSWDLIKDILPIPFVGNLDSVNAIAIDYKKGFFYTGGADKIIRERKITDFSEYAEIPTQMKDIQEFVFPAKVESFVFFHNSSEISAYDLKNEQLKNYEISPTTYIIVFAFNTKFLFAISKNNESDDYKSVISKYSCLDFNDFVLQSEGGGDDVILAADNTPNDLNLVCGTKRGFKIYSTENFNLIQEFFINGYVEKLIATNDFIIFEEKPNRLNKVVYNSKEINDFIIEPTDLLRLSCGQSKIFTYSNDSGMLKVFLSIDFTEVARISIPNLIDIYPHPQHLHFLVITNEGIIGYSGETFTKVFKIKSQGNEKVIVINESTMKMFVFTDQMLHPYEMNLSKDPNAPKAIIGTNYLRSKFEKYLNDFQHGKIKERDPQMEDFLLVPSHFNLLHYYAEHNKNEFLSAALQSKAGFICSTLGTPLDISINLKHDTGFVACSKFLKNEMIYNPMIMTSMKNPIVSIFESEFSNISLIFKHALSPSKTSELPDFVVPGLSLPIIIGSESVFPGINSFGLQGLTHENEGTQVTFVQTYFKFSFVAGSSESIKFLSMLNNTSDDAVYKTTFIKYLLEYKYQHTKYLLWLQFSIYFIYLLFLSLYTTVAFGDNKFLVSTFVLSIILFLYELVQFTVGGPLEYLKSPWNYLDISRFILQIIYCIITWSGYTFYTYYLLGVVIFLAFLRGISYFRLVTYTRYYINLLLQVGIDIFPFLILFMYSTVAFGLVFQRMENDSGLGYFSYLKFSYELNLGNFDTSTYDTFQYLFFFLNSMINPIIMLNLLVSVMGNTYSNVKDNQVTADLIELNDLVLEAELLMFWNRHRNEELYLCICKEADSDADSIDPVLSRANKIYLNLKDLTQKFEEERKKNEEERKKNNENIEKILETLNRIEMKQNRA